jgi:hypothetical protein
VMVMEMLPEMAQVTVVRFDLTVVLEMLSAVAPVKAMLSAVDLVKAMLSALDLVMEMLTAVAMVLAMLIDTVMVVERLFARAVEMVVHTSTEKSYDRR